MLKLSQTKFFLTGLTLILLFYVLNRVNHLIFGEKVSGTFIYYVEEDAPEGKLISPMLEYKLKDSVYRFKGREGSSYELDEEVTVLLLKKDPLKPVVYSIGSFWLFPLVYWILPLALWTAFALSWVGNRETVEFRLKYPFFSKKKKPLVRFDE